MTYEVVYGVGLLDDLHNYFPALLYEQGRFMNLTHVFHYIRTQMTQRFNLYAYGAQLYQETNPSPSPTPIFTTFPIPTTTPIPRHPMHPTNQNIQPTDDLATTTLLLSLLGGIGGIGGIRTPMTAGVRENIWNPVIIRPTAEQIENSSELVQGADLPANSVCSICQDTIVAADTCRKLRGCNHAYHRGCIDQWFERSVRCPTCRHDIREQ